MQKVITITEIKRFQGMEEAVLPAGAIVTPAAWDWARDHHLRLVMEGGAEGKKDAAEREVLLRGILVKVASELARQGRPVTRESLFEAVWRCLERRGAVEG